MTFEARRNNKAHRCICDGRYYKSLFQLAIECELSYSELFQKLKHNHGKCIYKHHFIFLLRRNQMQDTNIVVLKGRLTQAATLKILNSGTPCITFSIAVNDSKKNTNTGEWENVPNYFNITSFSKYAQSAIESLSKGREVLVTGRLRQEHWEKNGEKFYSVSVISDTLEILREPKNKSAAQTQSEPTQAPQFDDPEGCPF